MDSLPFILIAVALMVLIIGAFLEEAGRDDRLLECIELGLEPAQCKELLE